MMRPLEGSRVLVLGLGVTGRAMVRWLARRGAIVLASDAGTLDPEGRAELDDLDVEVETGSHDAAARWAEEVDFVVPSPGISPHRGFLSSAIAGGAEVVAELDLAQDATDARLVAVTGTKGKTTVCRLVARTLCQAGLSAYACGNTELPLVSALDDHPDADVFVVEASSFRLAFCRSFRPRVAVITNLAPDHLDWHRDMDDYTAAKARIAARQGSGDLYLYPAGQPELADLAPVDGPSRHAFGEPGSAAWVSADEVVVTLGPREVRARGAERLTARRPHMQQNVAAATAAAVALGADGRAISTALDEFAPDPHTLEYIGSVDGVSYYDDSKATNPTATLAALRSFEAPVLIAGGLNKGLDLTPLAAERARLRAVIAMGQAAEEVAEAFADSGVPVTVVAGMREAVEAARRQARTGDVVLLSPACASFDAYADYAERGREFRAICTSLGVGM